MNKIIKIEEFNSVSKNEILLISKNAKSTIKIEDLNTASYVTNILFYKDY